MHYNKKLLNIDFLIRNTLCIELVLLQNIIP